MDKSLAVSVFAYGDHAKVRVIMMDDEPWFVAKDVCDVLDLRNSRDALGRLDDDEKGFKLINGMKQVVEDAEKP